MYEKTSQLILTLEDPDVKYAFTNTHFSEVSEVKRSTCPPAKTILFSFKRLTIWCRNRVAPFLQVLYPNRRTTRRSGLFFRPDYKGKSAED